MTDDAVSLWGGGIKVGRAPANGELLIGNGSGFNLANITAGAGATVTNTAGGIQISATGTGIGTVTATSPLASSGGSTPDISLSGVVGVANGGTGRSSLTANNVILGNGGSAVQFVAPGASGNVLTSNGTTWQSTAPAGGYTLIQTNSTASGATSDFTSIPSGFTMLMLVFDNVSAATTSTSLQIALSTNNGSSYGSATSITGSLANTISLYGYFNIIGYNINSFIKIGGGALFFTTNGVNQTSPALNLSSTPIGVVNAIRVLYSSGNFDSGSISLYGL